MSEQEQRQLVRELSQPKQEQRQPVRELRQPAREQSQPTGQRKYYLDYLRVAAIVAVVLMHAAGRCCGGDDNARSYVWQVCNIFSSGTRWAVPIFVMISGSLFLDVHKRLPLRVLYGKYIRRLVYAYLFWAPIYVAYLALMGIDFQHANYTAPGGALLYIRDIFLGTLGGSDFHFWYLFMLAGVYMIAPLIKVTIDSGDEHLIRYGMGFMFVMSVVLPVFDHLDLFRGLFDEDLYNLGLGLLSNVYVFYFMLGWYLDTHSFSRRQRTVLYIAGMVCCLFTILSVGLSSYHTGTLDEYFRKNPRPNVMIMAMAVFVLIKHCLKDRQLSEKQQHLVTLLSRYSFGVFLSHLLFVRILASSIHISAGVVSPFLEVAVVFAGSLVASLILIHLMNRSRFLRSWVI